MVFCFLQGHAQLLQYDPIADSSLLASGLGFDHLVPGCSPILVRSPSFTLPQPLLSSRQSPVCVPMTVEMTSSILTGQLTERCSPSPRSGFILLFGLKWKSSHYCSSHFHFSDPG